MSRRVLAQLAISFLLGVLVSYWENPWGYVLWVAWLGSVGLMTVHGTETAYTAGTVHDTGRVGAAGAVRQSCRRYYSGILRVFFCLAFCLFGQLRCQQQQSLIQSVEDCTAGQSTLTVVGTIGKKEEKSWSIVYYLNDSEVINEKNSLPVGQVLIYQQSDTYSIGDTIQITGACENFEQAVNEGNFDAQEYYYSKGVFLAIKADSVRLLKHQHILWKEWLYRLRKQMQKVYAAELPEKEAGVLGVMTLGDKGMLDTELKKLYQQSGISHILAISGLHVSILGMGIYRFLRKLRMSYPAAGTLAGMIVLLFGELSGMEISTQRAVLMFLVMLLGNVLGLAYDSVTALSLSALLQLCVNPYCITYAGFVFSYSAVLAVVVAVKILEEAFERKEMSNTERASENGAGKSTGNRKGAESGKGTGSRKSIDSRGFTVKEWLADRVRSWKRTLVGTLFVSGCIQLVTLPLTVWFYYEFPLYSVLINGLLLPFMGLVLTSGLVGGIIGCTVGLLGGVGSGAAGATSVMGGGIAGALGTTMSWLVEHLSWLLLQPARVLLRWNECVCSLFNRLPGAVCVTGKPAIEMMIGYYVVLIGGLYFIYRMNDTEKKQSVGLRRIRLKKAVVLAVMQIYLFVLLNVRPNQGFRICFLDVGQGDGIYVQAEDGTAFFIDGGSSSEKKVGEYRLLSFLKYQGTGSVDGWFVSHADEDHISGLLELWESGYRVKRLFLSRWIVRDEAWEKLCAAAEQYQTEITYLAPEDTVGSGKLQFTCLYPWAEGTDRNSNSMVLYLQYPGGSALLGGDLSAKQERELALYYPKLKADIYKADHHGSNGSNSAAILQLIKPVVTVISCAEENSYGHPGKEAVGRIAEAGSRIYYTMESGQVTIGCDREGIWVKEYR